MRRALEPVARCFSRYFKVAVVAGPRQVGKTTMLKLLMTGPFPWGGVKAGSLGGAGATSDLSPCHALAARSYTPESRSKGLPLRPSHVRYAR